MAVVFLDGRKASAAEIGPDLKSSWTGSAVSRTITNSNTQANQISQSETRFFGNLMKIIILTLAMSTAAVNAMDYTAVFTAPPTNVPTHSMPDGPLLGNGDVGVVLAGPPETQKFYIGKNDFWARTPGSSKVMTVGRVEISIPGLEGGTYRQQQDLARAEVRGTFTKEGLTVNIRSRVDANENLLLTELQCEGSKPAACSVRLLPGEQTEIPTRVMDNDQPVNIGREQYGGGRWYFDGEISDVMVTNAALTGAVRAQSNKRDQFDGKTVWHELAVPKMEQSVSVAAWIKITGTNRSTEYIVSKGGWNQAYSLGLSGGRLRWSINGKYVQVDQPLKLDEWQYVVGTFDSRRMCLFVNGTLKVLLGQSLDPATGEFLRKADELPGQSREVAVATRIGATGSLDFMLKPGVPVTVATAILSDLDATDALASARGLVNGLTDAQISTLETGHLAWWSNFWSQSFIEIPDKEIEKHWYAALYVMGSCSRPGKVAPGLWGNWLTTDNPGWRGDFTLNYNFEAPFYMVYSANHADLSLPFYDAILESVPNGRAMAQRHGWKGIHFQTHLGPWGLFPEPVDHDWGQRSDAAFAALNFIWYWQYTQDNAWLRNVGYPYLREVADFWENYLKLENGRYVDYNDSIHEGSGPDVNPILSLGLIHALFKNMIVMSQELGLDGDRRAKWQDILDKISAYPLQERGGKTVFRYAETGTAWHYGNTLGIQHIFPAGGVGLDSDPKLLEISHNMIDEMNRWHDSNGFSSWYAACARIGYDPKIILTKLHEECVQCSLPNLLFKYPGGGIENVSGVLAINEMLLQSHEGVLRLFPCWPKDQDARFGNLRTVGAFLVSAELKEGTISGVKIISGKGKNCSVLNPWPGKTVNVIEDGKVSQSAAGNRFTLKTFAGETLQLQPN